MYSVNVRSAALARLASGESMNSVSIGMGVSRATLRAWRDEGVDARCPECPSCDAARLEPTAYAALLGFYLGDGAISKARGCHVMRVSCDATYPAIIEAIDGLIRNVHPGGRVFHVRAPGVVIVQSNWVHWPCLFPQHAPGRKHERQIRLELWQEEVIRASPAAFLRGLFHSDGARVANWARSRCGTRYDYPRWQFSNRSDDIHDLCQWGLDLVDVEWKRSNRWTTSVSKADAVAKLDGLIGLKSRA